MYSKKIGPQALFEGIKDLLSKEVVVESYSDLANKTKNYYEQFMLAMDFKKESSSNDIMATFNKKLPEEQQETFELACNLRQQLLAMKHTSEYVYNALLWLAYYFPLNDVTANNKLVCPLSSEVLNTQNRFVASDGFQYSKNYLLNNKDARDKLLSSDRRDLERLRPVIKKRNFLSEKGDLGFLGPLLIFSAIFGGIGGFAYGVSIGGVSLGFFTGFGIAMAGTFGGALIVPAATLLLWTIGYSIAKVYDRFNSVQHQLEALFLEPAEPLAKKDLTIKSPQHSQSPKTPSTPPAPTASNSPAFKFFSDGPAFEPPLAQPVNSSLKIPLAQQVVTKICPSRFLAPQTPAPKTIASIQEANRLKKYG